MEKLLVFIPAYNCEKQVTRVLSQLLDQRIAPWTRTFCPGWGSASS